MCLDGIVNGDVRSLGCLHTFHDNCLKEWFSVSDTCPLCRCSARPPEKHVMVEIHGFPVDVVIHDTAYGHLESVLDSLVQKGIRALEIVRTVSGLLLKSMPIKYDKAHVVISDVRWSADGTIEGLHIHAELSQ